MTGVQTCALPIYVKRERLRQILVGHDVTFQRTKRWKESNDPDRDAEPDRICEVLNNHPTRRSGFDEFGPLQRAETNRAGSLRCSGCDDRRRGTNRTGFSQQLALTTSLWARAGRRSSRPLTPERHLGRPHRSR